jgi:outer membrane protein assembly factor BamB
MPNFSIPPIRWGRSLSLAALAASGLVGASDGEKWPQFRGADQSGQTKSELPTEWSAEKNILWKVKIDGTGWSQPVIWGDKLFVTSAFAPNQPKPSQRGAGGGGGRMRGPGGFGPPGGAGRGGEAGKARGDNAEKGAPEGKRRGPPGGFPGPDGGGRRGGGTGPDVEYSFDVHCLDLATGKSLWKTTAVKRKPGFSTHGTNTYASETPVTDGERVYVVIGNVGLFAFDLAGKELWKHEFKVQPTMAGWGTGSSPVLDGDRLFIQNDTDGVSYLAAHDAKTGKQLWKIDRDEKTNWSTPFVWKHDGRIDLVVLGKGSIVGHDPATGKSLWELKGIGARCAATPIADGSMLYLGGGGGPQGNGPLMAVKGKADGKPEVVWERERSGPSMASPILVDGRLWIFDQRGGVVTCFDAQTGKDIFPKDRLKGAAGFTSSPWAAGGRIYATDDAGQTFVVESGSVLKVLATNKLDEMTWSSPAFAGGKIYFRTMEHLYCIGTK